jgi:hypothetical protein
VSDGLEAPVQLAYLVTLMGFLVVGAFLVVRQVLIRRELEEAAKVLGERVRTGQATSEVGGGAGGRPAARASCPGQPSAQFSGAASSCLSRVTCPATQPCPARVGGRSRPFAVSSPRPALAAHSPRTLAPMQDYFELGVILLRKKLYTQATKNLEKAQKGWQGEPEELAQVSRRGWLGDVGVGGWSSGSCRGG